MQSHVHCYNKDYLFNLPFEMQYVLLSHATYAYTNTRARAHAVYTVLHN